MNNVSKIFVVCLFVTLLSTFAYAQNQKLNDEAKEAIIGVWVLPGTVKETTIIITEDEFIYIPDPDRSKRVSNWLNPRTRKNEESYSSSELFENDNINVLGYTIENVKDLSNGKRNMYQLKGTLKLSDGRLLPFGVNVLDAQNPDQDKISLGTRKSDGTFEEKPSAGYGVGQNFERENARESRYKLFEEQVNQVRNSNFYKGSKTLVEAPKESE